jgi:hypothetical protein
MNAKRSSDRFFKPGLESSSLSIPAAVLMANVAERMRREIVALVDAGSSPVVRPNSDSFRDGVTGNTPGSELGE